MSLAQTIEHRKELKRFEELRQEVTPVTNENVNPNPQSRLILLMRAANTSVADVARSLNVTQDYVRYVERLPWYKKEMTLLIRQRGGQIVEEMIKQHGPDAVNKMAQLMHSPTVPPEIQQRSAKFFLDKLVADKIDVQRIQHLPPTVVSHELQVIDDEIKAIEDGSSGRPNDSKPQEAEAGTPATTPSVA